VRNSLYWKEEKLTRWFIITFPAIFLWYELLCPKLRFIYWLSTFFWRLPPNFMEMFILILINTLLSTLFSLMVLYLTLNILLFRGILEPLLTQQIRKYTKKFRSPLPQYISFSLFSTFTRIYQRTCGRQTLGGRTWMNCLHTYIYIYIYIYTHVMHIIYCIFIYIIFIRARHNRRLYPCSKHISLSTQLSPQ
jgi:hypothetical protein